MIKTERKKKQKKSQVSCNIELRNERSIIQIDISYWYTINNAFEILDTEKKGILKIEQIRQQTEINYHLQLFVLMTCAQIHHFQVQGPKQSSGNHQNASFYFCEQKHRHLSGPECSCVYDEKLK